MTQLPANQSQNPVSIWDISNQGKVNIQAARNAISMKHGMFAGVPIICRGGKCPFINTCMIPIADLQVGERCPIEIAAILERFERYCDSLEVDPDDPKQTIDLGFIKDLVDIEVTMIRADQKLAFDADVIESVVSAVGPDGTAHYKNEANKALDIKERLRRDRQRILDQLNASRKAKESSLKGMVDASTQAAKLMAKVRELKEQGVLNDVVDGEIVDE